MSFVFVLSSDAQCAGECSPTLQSHTVDEFYLLKRKRTQYKAKQHYFFLSLKTVKAKFKHSMEMSKQTTNFSVIRFYCGLLITLSWDLCSKLQKKTWMGVLYGDLHSVSTHCMPLPHLCTALQLHSPQVGSLESCRRPLPGWCDINEALEQQQLVLCLQIPDGQSHFGAPLDMCLSQCPWLAGRPSTAYNLQ